MVELFSGSGPVGVSVEGIRLALTAGSDVFVLARTPDRHKVWLHPVGAPVGGGLVGAFRLRWTSS